MPDTEPTVPATADRAPGPRWWPVLALVAAVSLLRILYLIYFCPYSLLEDEAFYWEWSRHLDWSFYSKGPGIALLIAAPTSILGTAEWTIRLVAVLSAGLTSIACAGLAMDLSRRPRAGFTAAALTLLAPGLQFMGIVTTIDGPYLAAWALAAWAAWRALMRGSWSAWPALGLAVAIGFLIKYMALMLLPGVLVVALARRRTLVLHPRWRSGLALGIALVVIAMIPVIAWNWAHDWGGARHLLGTVRLPGGDRVIRGERTYNPMWTLELLGAQIGLAGPAVLLGLWASFRRRAWWGSDWLPLNARALLVWIAIPIFVLCTASTFLFQAQANWPVAGNLTLLILAACVWPTAPQRAASFLVRQGVQTVVVVGVIFGVGMLRLDWVRDALAPISPWAARIMPVARLTDVPKTSAEIWRRFEHLRSDSPREPFIICERYSFASQLVFYGPGRPMGVVHCASSQLGLRTVQQDFWPDVSLDRPDLVGRTALLVGGDERWSRFFDRIETLPPPAPDGKGPYFAIGYGYHVPAPAQP